MSEPDRVDDPLAGWDPRRRQALQQLWDTFAANGGKNINLVDELLSERRTEAHAQDHPDVDR